MQLLMWSLICTVSYFEYLLQKNPKMPLLSTFSPILRRFSDKQIELVKAKSHMEILIGLLSSFGWLIGWCAPIFSIAFIQYLRVKAVSSEFARHSFVKLYEVLSHVLPSIIFDITIKPLGAYLKNLKGVKESVEVCEQIKQK